MESGSRGQEARPFARNHFQPAEKTHSFLPFRHVQGPRETSPGPGRWLPPARSRSRGARHPIVPSHTPKLPARHQPQVSASPLSLIVVSGTFSHPLTRLATQIPPSRVCPSLPGHLQGHLHCHLSCLTITAVPSPQTANHSSAALVTSSPSPTHSHASSTVARTYRRLLNCSFLPPRAELRPV